MTLKLSKSEKFEKRRQAWEKTRQHGKTRFILTQGVLGWGIVMIIVGDCIDIFIDHKNLGFHPIRSLFLILIGCLVGLMGWNDNDRRFHCTPEQKDLIDETRPD